MWKKSVSFYAYLLLIVIFVFANFNIGKWKTLSVINWDIISYYDYLPGTFIYHDYKLNFLNNGIKLDEEVRFWPVKAPNGNYLNKMTMGMSVLYSPFFFLAHIQSQAAGTKANGFSWYYHKYIHLSCLFYFFIGLFFLRKLLLKWFGEWPVALSLVTITVGTNLFYFATTEAPMSHVYNFSLAAIYMYFISAWFENNKIKYAIIIGITLGLLILIRPVNIIFSLFPLFFNLNSPSSAIQNIRMFFSRPLHLLLVIGLCFLIFLPQLLYWKSVTGQYFFFSYLDERFFFLRPMIFHGLFSFRNGWLTYSPIMIFSLIGIYLLHKQKFHSTPVILIISILYVYAVFSWWCWWYVGFGNRAMIDLYSLLAIPMTAFYAWLITLPTFKKIGLYTLIFILVGFNLFQTMQYRLGLVHFDSMNFKAYKASFGKLYYTEEFKSALKTPDYEKAKKGLED